ncbi:MAG: gamma subclass chorismate mutase AroQ [Chlamydiales bacterium]|nr:gamma subclass chorismate mutase AroQ [Chlamydiales bacterium]
MNRFLILIVFPFLVCSSIRAESQTIPPHQKMAEIMTAEKIDQILLLMQKRLAVMHEVARWKWNHGYSIEDKTQERRVVDEAVNTAVQQGIPTEWAMKFVQAQMDAAKIIQAHDFEIWRRESIGHFDEICDLRTEIRPYLMDLTGRLLETIGNCSEEISQHPELLVISPLSVRESDQFPISAWRCAISMFTDKKEKF